VEHYRIYLTNNNQYPCDHDEFFDNLIQLVSHYKRDADGLCHRLVTPLVSDVFRQVSAVVGSI
jgi:c-src tyrosine kinase